MATASLVLGIIALALIFNCCCFPFSLISIVLGILAIVFGAIAIKQAKQNGKSEPMAITGLILGIISTVACIVLMVFIIIGFTFLENTPFEDLPYYDEYSTASKVDM